jgi:predicted regulator of Ras-like GTPase activity (Roadblock/LC7/MglB family)
MNVAELNTALEQVTQVPRVLGAMVVSADEGIVVGEALMEGLQSNAVAALAASVSQKLAQTTGAAGLGSPSFVHLAAENGALLAVPAGLGLVIVVVAGRDVNVGLARLEMLKVAETIG